MSTTVSEVLGLFISIQHYPMIHVRNKLAERSRWLSFKNGWVAWKKLSVEIELSILEDPHGLIRS